MPNQEDIIVTGSRIARPGLTSISPVATLDHDEIQLDRAVNIETVLGVARLGKRNSCPSGVMAWTAPAGPNRAMMRPFEVHFVSFSLPGLESGQSVNGHLKLFKRRALRLAEMGGKRTWLDSQ